MGWNLIEGGTCNWAVRVGASVWYEVETDGEKKTGTSCHIRRSEGEASAGTAGVADQILYMGKTCKSQAEIDQWVKTYEEACPSVHDDSQASPAIDAPPESGLPSTPIEAP